MTHRPFLFLASLGAGAMLAGAATAHSGQCGGSYEIQSGDTLYEVTQKCRIGLSRVMELNPAIDPRALSIGQSVRLKAEGHVHSQAGRDEDGGDDGRQAPDGDNLNPAPAPDARGSYRVESGDTAYGIARRLGISLMELLNANEDINPLALAAGEVLEVPTGDRSAGFSIEPHRGPAGADVAVRAHNLRPDDWVTVGVGPASSEWEALDQARTSSTGRLRTSVAVPDWADPGDVLTFVVDTDRGVTLKSGDFRVVRAEDENERDRMTLRGRVRDGVECPVLRTPDGDVWSLTGADANFTAGEYVEVKGRRAGMSFCQQGVGTLEVTAIDEIAPPRDDDGNRDAGLLDRAFVTGPWTAKGSDCSRPDFDVTRYPGGGLAVETSVDGRARTGDVALYDDASFVFDQGGGRFEIESRGEGELAVIPTERDNSRFGGLDLGADGVVFVKCPA
ncbi:LysM peptidoglycan-binding domain-containing protein [Minwuia thermotolerans]|nr:LysM peptidoglycan-binding domain-containing protein [Minwuia thermotolerans]